MNYIYSILLGAIQGLGEFLPVAGSGLLLMMKKAFSLPQWMIQDPWMDAVLRWGALLAVILLFRKSVWELLKGMGALVKGIFNGSFKWRKAGKYQIMAVYLLLATLPMLILAVVQQYYNILGKWSDHLLFVGVMLLASAGLVFIGSHSLCRNWGVREMKAGHALKMGLFQAVSCLPGLSRTGTTLSMAQNMGFDREAALEFSMMMTLPTLLGTNLMRLGDLSVPSSSEFGVLAVGFLAALVFGGLALALLKWLIRKDRFGWLTYYCLAAGIAAIVLYFK